MKTLQRYKSIVATSLSDIYAHPPVSSLGQKLLPDEKVLFASLCHFAKMFVSSRKSREEFLVDITDIINNLPDSTDSMDLLSEFIEYLRIQLMSSKPIKVHRTIKICDVMVKNCCSLVHILIGQQHFLYTISKVSRWWLLQGSGRKHSKHVAAYGLDCLQAWGEAFEPRKYLYPHYYSTYMQLRGKPYVEFTRPQYDTSRVPIFLGPITSSEIALMSTHQQRTKEQCDKVPKRSHLKNQFHSSDAKKMGAERTSCTVEGPETNSHFHMMSPPLLPPPPIPTVHSNHQPEQTNISESDGFSQFPDPSTTQIENKPKNEQSGDKEASEAERSAKDIQREKLNHVHNVVRNSFDMREQSSYAYGSHLSASRFCNTPMVRYDLERHMNDIDVGGYHNYNDNTSNHQSFQQQSWHPHHHISYPSNDASCGSTLNADHASSPIITNSELLKEEASILKSNMLTNYNKSSVAFATQHQPRGSPKKPPPPPPPPKNQAQPPPVNGQAKSPKQRTENTTKITDQELKWNFPSIERKTTHIIEDESTQATTPRLNPQQNNKNNKSKPTHYMPSSDCRNEYMMYGNTRVVVRRDATSER